MNVYGRGAGLGIHVDLLLVKRGLKYRALDFWNHVAHPTGLNTVYMVIDYIFFVQK